MRITKLQIHNFLGLSYVKLTKIGKIVRVTGENGVGKSSILLAIKEALKSSGVKPTLIKTGEDMSEIMVELDDRIAIHRTITETKNEVNVRVDGAPQKKPVAFLESLVGGLGINPIEFFLAKPAQQRAIILKALPVKLTPKMLTDIIAESDVSIDLSNIDYDNHGLTILAKLQKDIYDRRHLINQDVTRLKKSIEQDIEDLPANVEPERFDGFKLDERLKNLQTAQDQISSHEHDIENLERLRIEFSTLNDQKAAIEDLIDKNMDDGLALKAKSEAYIDPEPDKIKEDIDAFSFFTEQQATLEGIERKRKDLTTRETEHRALDWLHDKVKDELPQTLIEEADIPISGLKIMPEGIMVAETPLNQLSEGERIVFSTTLSRALSGETKMVCIDGFESIVGKLRKGFEAEMEKDDVEYFIAEATPDERLAVDGGTLSTEQEDAAQE